MRNCIINFHAIFNTIFGDQIYILGNHPQLGQWHFQKALKMTTDKHSYPKWKSIKKIRISQDYQLQFKVCVFNNNKFKSWENFPINQNRSFKADCRGITLLIIENNHFLIQQKRFDNFSSNQIFPMQVRKYTSIVQEELQSEQDSSSSSGYNDYYQKVIDNSEGKGQHNIKSLISTFRYILWEGLIKIKQKNIKRDQLNKQIEFKYKTKKFMFLINSNKKYNFKISDQNIIKYIQMQVPTKIQNKNIMIPFNFDQINQDKNSEDFDEYALILYGIQFCFLIKSIKKQINMSNNINRKIILYILQNQIIKELKNNINKQQIIEQILQFDYLVFKNEQTLNFLMIFFQIQNFQVKLKRINYNKYVLFINQKQIFINVEHCLQNLSQIQIPIINKQQNINSISDQLLINFQKCNNKKAIFFSFGQYQNLQVLIKNKQILHKLSQQILIYVFTPNQLKHFADIIQMFPKIVFISYTYLQLAYNRQTFYLLSIPQTQIYLADLIQEIQQEISIHPNLKLYIQNNIIYVKLEEKNKFNLDIFQSISSQIMEIVNNFNEITEQNLVYNRINRTTIAINHTYQSQIFFTNLILKNTQIPIQFLMLLSVDKFKNFRFNRQMKKIINEKRNCINNTKFYYSFEYTNSKGGPSSARNFNAINPKQFTKLLNQLFKHHSSDYLHKQKLINMKLIQKIRFPK